MARIQAAGGRHAMHFHRQGVDEETRWFCDLVQSDDAIDQAYAGSEDPSVAMIPPIVRAVDRNQHLLHRNRLDSFDRLPGGCSGRYQVDSGSSWPQVSGSLRNRTMVALFDAEFFQVLRVYRPHRVFLVAQIAKDRPLPTHEGVDGGKPATSSRRIGDVFSAHLRHGCRCGCASGWRSACGRCCIRFPEFGDSFPTQHQAERDRYSCRRSSVRPEPSQPYDNLDDFVFI